MDAQLASPKQIIGTRVDRLRKRIIDAPQEVCIERARLFTRAMAKHWDDHPLTRMSLGLEEILTHASVIIRQDEIIVGCRTSKLKGAPLFPENKIRWIEGDVDSFDHRQIQRALITEEEKQILKEEIIPFWTGKSVEEDFEFHLSQDVADDVDKYIFTFMLEITYGIGHFTMNHERILATGMAGAMETAQAGFEALSEDEKKGEKSLFYKAVIRSLRAAITFARRYAEKAREMASTETDPVRAAELLEIARVCSRVPEHPAESFHEAVQCVYFVHLISQIESGGNSISLGRIDQYLYPFYQQDLAAGRIDPDRARELLALLFLKTNEIWNVLEEAYIPGGEGTEGKTTQNVTVGGMGKDGEDATNGLSHVALNAFCDIRLVQPNFGVRVCDGTDDLFFARALSYAKDGVPLHFFNDRVIVDALVQAGHSMEDARDYGVVGCLEPNAQGKSFGSTFAVQFNGIKCLEFALSDGVDNIFGYPSGLETGDPAGFDTFEDLWAAYDRQLSHYIGQMVRGITCLDEAIARRVPSPFASAMIDGPLEKGVDLTRGGAIYNSTGVQLMGYSNIVDSLFAVKQAVFEEKRFSMEALTTWLADDWTDAEDKRTCLLNKVPKYGNDHDGVDQMAARVLGHFCDVLAGHRNFRGGAFWPGVFSVGFHITMGAFTGATPDGRYAGDVLGNGITPSNGAALNGPTAVLNSATKLPLSRVTNGLNLNMRFAGSRIRSQALLDLMKGYFKRGGAQVQFNMVETEQLKAAQKEPEKFRDLVVRISGYSALFVNLSDIAQSEIISRMQYDL
ncbi:MAG: formate C-acetyltransferase/glycerol dehydratase family glycyl radical enzyme [Desulfobacterales bacterium]|nr:formate C-acetyltransferase/glycerol dehydratase family glycyl radical enzyme [Desulfobacterales bacterium]